MAGFAWLMYVSWFLKNHKNIGFLRNTGLDLLKITKLPSQHSMLGHHRHASETPFKWRWLADDGPLILPVSTKKTRQSWTSPNKTL